MGATFSAIPYPYGRNNYYSVECSRHGYVGTYWSDKDKKFLQLSCKNDLLPREIFLILLNNGFLDHKLFTIINGKVSGKLNVENTEKKCSTPQCPIEEPDEHGYSGPG